MNQPLRLFLIALSGAFLSTAIQAAPITVKDLKGRGMIVEVIQYAPATGKVKIKRTSDSQVFDVELKVFDAESQKKLVESAPAAKAELEITGSIGRRRKRQGASSYMKNQEVTLSLKIENESKDAALDEGKFTVFLVGRATARYANRNADGAKVLSKQVFTGTIPPYGEFKHECKPVITEYDSDRDSSNIGGWEFDGYLLVIHDKEGNLIATETSLANVENETLKDPKKLAIALAQKEGALVERNLLPK